MAEIVAKPFEDPESPGVPREEITSAAEVIQAMIKTAKSFRMYQPNNPLIKRFEEELKIKMERHFSLYGDYKLDIDQFELRYKGNTIYENREPKESLAFKMFSDGIRSLIFSDGIEERELLDFVEIVGFERPGEVDDDIVTLLWEKDLPNLTYILAEDFLEFDHVGVNSAGGSQQEKINGIYSDIPPDLPAVPLLIPQQILTLTESELDWLKKAREADARSKPLDEVIYILSAILNGVKDEDTFEDFVEIMAQLTANMLLAGEVHYALSLIRFLHNLAIKKDLLPERRRMIVQAMSGIFTEKMVPVLQQTVDTTELIGYEELRTILHIFGRGSLRAMCELLALVETMKMRRVILEVLIALGKERSEVFASYLADDRWYLVRNMVFILTRLKASVHLEQVARLIFHPEARVRKEVLLYLEQISDPMAKTYLLKFLKDDSSALRVKALQVISRSKLPAALKSIAALATSEEFEHLSLVEKKAVFETLGELGSHQVVPLMKGMLLKKYWFNKGKEKESVVCAVAGLMRVRGEAAIKALEEACNAKGEELRAIILPALEVLLAEREKGTIVREEG